MSVEVQPGEVHLWYVHSDAVTDRALLQAYHGLMSAEEVARHDRFLFARHRHQFLVAQALVRTTLARYCGIAPQAVSFVNNAYGKPRLADGIPGAARLEFNLSHTEGLIVCGVTAEAAIGVDVEQTARRLDLAMARHYFARPEVQQLECTAPAAQRELFFEFWTLKEAYIKARGLGLSLPLSEFAFELSGREAPHVRFAPQLQDDPSCWQFFQLRPAEGYQAAVAVRRPVGADVRLVTTETVPSVAAN